MGCHSYMKPLDGNLSVVDPTTYKGIKEKFSESKIFKCPEWNQLKIFKFLGSELDDFLAASTPCVYIIIKE